VRGVALGLSRGGDGRRHVHGRSWLLAALGCDLLWWLEVVEGWSGRLAWWVGCLLGPDVELGVDVAYVHVKRIDINELKWVILI
jgi:hypothetical protein